MRLVARHFGKTLPVAGTLLSASAATAAPSGAGASWPILLLFLLLAGAATAIVILLVRLRRVRRECERLAAANAVAQRALHTRSEFLATTSHEIRTPLNGILGMTQVLLADAALPASARERVGLVHGAGETMKALVDDILDIAKIEAGGLTIDSVPFDLRRLFDEVQRLWRVEAERKGLQLHLDLAGSPSTIEGDPLRLRQIVGNLMSNAIKFTDHGSVSLSVRAEPSNGGERLVIVVGDTGIGVAPRQQDLIFEKYRQADGSITRRFGGTGLGLAICRSLARAMGGSVSIDSVPGQGSTFTVSLPLVRSIAAGPQAMGGAGGRPLRLSAARLLVVEPNALTRRVIVKMLAGAVGGIDTAASLSEAEERLARGGIDHVVADFDCIAGDAAGDTPADRLYAQTAVTGTPLTLLFAPGRDAAVAACVADRPNLQPIAKPIGAAALIAALARLYGEDGAVDAASETRPLLAAAAE